MHKNINITSKYQTNHYFLQFSLKRKVNRSETKILYLHYTVEAKIKLPSTKIWLKFCDYWKESKTGFQNYLTLLFAIKYLHNYGDKNVFTLLRLAKTCFASYSLKE